MYGLTTVHTAGKRAKRNLEASVSVALGHGSPRERFIAFEQQQQQHQRAAASGVAQTAEVTVYPRGAEGVAMEFSAPQMLQGSSTAAPSLVRGGLSVRAKPVELAAAAAETTIGTSSALETLRSGASGIITHQSPPAPGVSPVQRTRFRPTSAFSPRGMEPAHTPEVAERCVHHICR